MFSDIAENIVKKCLKPKSKKEKLTLNQIRKFYDEVLNYESLIKSAENKKEEEEFKEWIPFIRMLKAKAHVAYERGNINENFKIFIEKNIDYIGESYEKFKVFVKFFEAIVAYSKGTLE
ncbi:type III-A CRISPR-associated protein Csm2 [Peptococcaceae bacterium]|nr:type III-A CRISPR-associated protein Csm2 [Peptococcaceae bacterium]